MKTIAIVSKKMITGGVEKALIAMLKKFDFSKFSVDLYLEQLGGEQISNLPKEVNVYQIPAFEKKDMYRHPFLGLKKLFYILIIKFGKHSYLKECFYASQMLFPSHRFQGIEQIMCSEGKLYSASPECRGGYIHLG